MLLAPARTGRRSALNRLAFEWLQLAGPKLRQTGPAGGRACSSPSPGSTARSGWPTCAPTADPTAGGLAGLVKTARHEWPEVACKAIDLAPAFADDPRPPPPRWSTRSCPPARPRSASRRRTAARWNWPAPSAGRPAQPINLGPKDVILVTGGGRGVTAEAAVALAETYPADARS